MPAIRSSYIVPFSPALNSIGERASADERFNRHGFRYKRGSRASPYPSSEEVFKRSSRRMVDDDMFEDVYLLDLVDANKRYGKWLGISYVKS